RRVIGYLLPDKAFIALDYRRVFGRWPNFNPVTEKSPSSKLPLLTNVRVKVGDESVDILM
ncbi:MAG: hypothetical protein R6W99_08495, partial [Clostridia bacterium]